MIRLKRSRITNDIPVPFRAPRLERSASKLIDLYYKSLSTGKFDFDSNVWKSAKDRLKQDSYGKCAYCEADTAVVAHGDVEHFRPKSKYWWLAYCYDNFLYSCQICNQSYKGDEFPMNANALSSPQMPGTKPNGQALNNLISSLVVDAAAYTDAVLHGHWSSEDSNLVNPYFEDPTPLFEYEADDANKEMWLRGAAGQRPARIFNASEKFLGLNREELRRSRYSDYLRLATFKVLLSSQLPIAAKQLAETEVLRMQSSSEPYAGMRRFFAKKWGLPTP